MRRLKKYEEYMSEMIGNNIPEIDPAYYSIDLMESLSIWHDTLLDSIKAKEMDIFDTLKLPKDDYEPLGKSPMDLDYLCGSGEKSPDERFVNSLASMQLKKSQVQNTDDYETFLNKPCKFMFIYGSEANELENPLYIMLQVWNDLGKKWSDAALYKVNDDVKKFYDKLSSKTIEILDGDQNYIYTTSNGNEWTLKNSDKENDIYKKALRKEEIQDLVNSREVSINII
jgi:hypothetical protein